MRLVKGLLNRCLRTLEVLAADPQWHRLSDIAEKLELQRGPAHRLLNELIELGWVEQHLATEHYRLTLRLAIFGQQYLYGSGLPGLVQPILDDTAARSRELVRLTVIDDDRLMWLAASQGAPPGLVYQPRMNGAVALHTTANGKAWLATMHDADAARIAAKGGLGKPARSQPGAVKTSEALLKELATTRKRGYGQALEEAEHGVNAIAVALHAMPDNRVVGTMSIAGPSHRVAKSRFPELHQLLVEASGKLSLVWPLQPVP